MCVCVCVSCTMECLLSLYLFLILAMSDQSKEGSNIGHPNDDGQAGSDVSGISLPDVSVNVVHDGSRKRGPADCLDWEDSDEEFTPYTQENPVPRFSPPAKKVFAKKSAAKKVVSKKNGAKNARAEKATSSISKGKCLGN